MTLRTNYLQGGGYNAIDLVNEFDALFADGVITGLAVTQNGSPNLSVNVAIGSGIKTGLFLNNDAIVNLIIVGNPSGFNRIDVVYADMDNNIFGVQQGIANSSPTPPALSGNKIALSQVAVGNGVGVINTANLTDVRVYADLFQPTVKKTYGYHWGGTLTHNVMNTITHNLGHIAVVVCAGTNGNVFLQCANATATYIQLYAYCTAANDWTGDVYCW